jgi:hypothetical protein
LCPADRFFEIHKELRDVIERGIKDNLEELALRGEPKAPFYMVGRMGGESVVIRAEAGKLRLDIDREKQRTVYDNKGEQNELDREQGQTSIDPAQRGGEVPGGVVGLEREEKSLRGMQGAGDPTGAAHPLARTGDGSDAAGVGAEDSQRSVLAGLGAETPEAAFATSAQAGRQSGSAQGETGEDPATDKASSETELAERTADDQTGRGPGAA